MRRADRSTTSGPHRRPWSRAAARDGPPSWIGHGAHASGFPVEVRRAAQWGVQYLVPAAAAQRIVGPTGLEVTGPVPGRALMALAVCRYDDTDLDPYHEVAVSFVVRPHDAPPAPVGGPADRGSSSPGPSAPTSTGSRSTRSSPAPPAGTSGASPSG